ncbi:hypothetical protein ACFXTO_007075 [Malus domestica]
MENHFHVFISENNGVVVLKENPLQLGSGALKAIVLENMHESFSSSNLYFQAIFELVEEGFKLRVFLGDLLCNGPLPLEKVKLNCVSFHVWKAIQSHSRHFLFEHLLFRGSLIVFLWHIDGKGFVT